jgi:glutamyl-tRNA synthetase
VSLLKERANSVPQLAEEAMLFYSYEKPVVQLDGQAATALRQLKDKLASVNWQRADIGAAIKEVLKSSGLKMPQLAMPLRLIVTGRTQTPSVDAVLELIGRDTVLNRLSMHLGSP